VFNTLRKFVVAIRNCGVLAFSAIAVLALNASGLNAAAREVAPRQLPTDMTTVRVFMTDGVTAAQLGYMRALLVNSPRVARFAYLDERQALEDYRHMRSRHRAIGPSGVRPLFRVRLNHDGDVFGFISEVQTIDGFSDVYSEVLNSRAQHCRPEAADLEVFIAVGTTPDQVASIGASLRADSSIAVIRSISPAHALRTYKCLTRGSPDSSILSRGDLPASFRIVVASHQDFAALAERLRALPGVDAVTQLRAMTARVSI